MGLNIVKQSGANTVDVAHAVKRTLEEIKQLVPSGVEIVIATDNSIFTEEAVHDVIVNMIYGGTLAVIVIFLFLADLRPTIISAIAIPTSIVATFTFMGALGFTLNFMTLLGLSLAVGLLIDDAIVVIENIYRHYAMKKEGRVAAYDGTREIALAVLATTFTIVVVFVPVAFMKGIVGQFFLLIRNDRCRQCSYLSVCRIYSDPYALIALARGTALFPRGHSKPDLSIYEWLESTLDACP